MQFASRSPISNSIVSTLVRYNVLIMHRILRNILIRAICHEKHLDALFKVEMMSRISKKKCPTRWVILLWYGTINLYFFSLLYRFRKMWSVKVKITG